MYKKANEMLDDIVKSKKIKAYASFGFWPCNSSNDDIHVYKDEKRSETLGSFRTLR